MGIEVFATDDREYVQVSIVDSMIPPMDKLDIERYQGDDDVMVSLYITHILIELQGGEFWSERTAESHTVYSVALPVAV